MQLVLEWADSTDGNFPGSNAIPVDIAAGEDWITLRLDEMPAWSGAVKRFGLGMTGKEGDKLTLHSLAFARQPEGPAKLSVIAFGGEQSIYAVGEPSSWRCASAMTVALQPTGCARC